MTEIWKALVGYEGLYEVSDFGRVRSQSKKAVMRAGPHPGGYLVVHAGPQCNKGAGWPPALQRIAPSAS